MFGLALASTVRELDAQIQGLITALDNSHRRESRTLEIARALTSDALALTERCKALLGADTAPAQLAEVFIAMTDSQQAAFFNRVGKLTDEWKSPGRWIQFSAMGGQLDTAGCQLLNELAIHTPGAQPKIEIVIEREHDNLPPQEPPAEVIERAVFETMRSLAEEHGRKMFHIELICNCSHAHHTKVREALYSLHHKGKVVLNDLPPDASELHRIQAAGLSLEVPV